MGNGYKPFCEICKFGMENDMLPSCFCCSFNPKNGRGPTNFEERSIFERLGDQKEQSSSYLESIYGQIFCMVMDLNDKALVRAVHQYAVEKGNINGILVDEKFIKDVLTLGINQYNELHQNKNKEVSIQWYT